MSKWDHLKNRRVVRLNATMFPVHPVEEAYYRRYGLDPLRVEAATPEEIISHVADCDALLVVAAALPRPVIEALECCRLISRLGNGTDKIDVAAAARRGIVVSNAPFFCVAEMSDHIMALQLALARQLPRMEQFMYAGDFSQARKRSMGIQRLSCRTLGIVGFGATGERVAQRAKAFGLRVLATRRNTKAPTLAADALGVEMVDLDTLLEQSDYVSLQLPLNEATYHLFDEATLRKMKPGAYLINTSRGALVDEAALVRLLRQGHLAGAGLDTYEGIDVFTEEVKPPSHPLVELDNVILTPHVSAHSVQAVEDVSRTGVENLVAVLSGHWPTPENIVNKGVVPRSPLKDHDPSLFEES